MVGYNLNLTSDLADTIVVVVAVIEDQSSFARENLLANVRSDYKCSTQGAIAGSFSWLFLTQGLVSSRKTTYSGVSFVAEILYYLFQLLDFTS